MRHQHQLGLLLLDKTLQHCHKAVWRVGLEFSRLDRIHLAHFLGRNLGRNRADATADYRCLQHPARLGCNLLRARQSFPGNPVQLAFPLFHYHQNRVSHFSPFLRVVPRPPAHGVTAQVIPSLLRAR